MNLESLHSIATLVAQHRQVDTVLDTIVQSLVDGSDLALARIWLIGPGDLCNDCQMRQECPDQRQCLHLVASAARPCNPDSGDQWHLFDGFYRRFPLGIRRIGWIGSSGQSLKLSSTADDQEWFARNDWLHLEGVQSFSGHPLLFRDEVLGVLGIFSRQETTDEEFRWLRAFADNAAVAIANARAFEQIESLKTRLEQENEYLRDEIRSTLPVTGMIGQSAALKKVLEQVELVAATDASVLILGESGAGKELVARAIHQRSPRADKPMIKVNCASIPRELFESEFFGHVKGSFTGAIRDRAGRFELADGGTLFLDEVGEIPLEMQSKLLRVLQEGSFERIGDAATRSTDVRIVAATNRDLVAEIGENRFREDLYYRLSVFPIELPGLRDRAEDIAPLAAHFIAESSAKLGIEPPELKQRHISELQRYAWPGNIRELQNVIERAVILSRTNPLEFHLPGESRTASQSEQASTAESAGPSDLLTYDELKELERRNLVAVLERANWKISGVGGAAEILGINPATLSSRMRSMGIRRER